ncbi:hypothetical protein JKP88DRAFT_240911 [Tribonema minus]|uniref:Uncharacterized protein n=1 Tax=Tribonema minus TaxID=303371 RepID=A0A836CIB5_9STRA|nr:hypothetical protein JKP88DRAFT_240911 [Tribonema minus]
MYQHYAREPYRVGAVSDLDAPDPHYSREETHRQDGFPAQRGVAANTPGALTQQITKEVLHLQSLDAALRRAKCMLLFLSLTMQSDYDWSVDRQETCGFHLFAACTLIVSALDGMANVVSITAGDVSDLGKATFGKVFLPSLEAAREQATVLGLRSPQQPSITLASQGMCVDFFSVTKYWMQYMPLPPEPRYFDNERVFDFQLEFGGDRVTTDTAFESGTGKMRAASAGGSATVAALPTCDTCLAMHTMDTIAPLESSASIVSNSVKCTKSVKHVPSMSLPVNFVFCAKCVKQACVDRVRRVNCVNGVHSVNRVRHVSVVHSVNIGQPVVCTYPTVEIGLEDTKQQCNEWFQLTQSLCRCRHFRHYRHFLHCRPFLHYRSFVTVALSSQSPFRHCRPFLHCRPFGSVALSSLSPFRHCRHFSPRPATIYRLSTNPLQRLTQHHATDSTHQQQRRIEATSSSSMRDLRSTGFQWERDWERSWDRYKREARVELALKAKTEALDTARWANGTHPARQHLWKPAPALLSPASLLKRAGAGVIVVNRSIIRFLGTTDVRYQCFQHSLAAEVALSYTKTIRKNKKRVQVVVTHDPTVLPVAHVSVSPKMNVQLVPALSNTQVIKYCRRQVPTQCDITVSMAFPGSSAEVLIALPLSLEADAVAGGALVHTRTKDTVVIRVQRNKALDKALAAYFKVPDVAHKLNAICIENIQSFL